MEKKCHIDYDKTTVYYNRGVNDVEEKIIADVIIVTIIPRVDAANAKTVETQLTEIINGGTRKLICNFSQNEYISSAGLRVFLSTLKMMKKSGGEIVLCGLQPYVQEVFDMAGFSQLFTISGSEAEAVKAFN